MPRMNITLLEKKFTGFFFKNINLNFYNVLNLILKFKGDVYED